MGVTIVVRRIAEQPDRSSAVVRSATPLLALMHRCGATVIVGEIQTQAQADWWELAGADIGQDRFFASPSALEHIGTFLDTSCAEGS